MANVHEEILEILKFRNKPRHVMKSLYFNYFSILILNKTLIINTKNCKKVLLNVVGYVILDVY